MTDLVLTGRVLDSGEVSTHVDSGTFSLQMRKAFSSISAHVIVQPQSARSLDQRPPSQPISSALPALLSELENKIRRRSMAVMYNPRRVSAISSQ